MRGCAISNSGWTARPRARRLARMSSQGPSPLAPTIQETPLVSLDLSGLTDRDRIRLFLEAEVDGTWRRVLTSRPRRLPRERSGSLVLRTPWTTKFPEVVARRWRYGFEGPY